MRNRQGQSRKPNTAHKVAAGIGLPQRSWPKRFLLLVGLVGLGFTTIGAAVLDGESPRSDASIVDAATIESLAAGAAFCGELGQSVAANLYEGYGYLHQTDLEELREISNACQARREALTPILRLQSALAYLREMTQPSQISRWLSASENDSIDSPTLESAPPDLKLKLSESLGNPSGDAEG